MFKSFLACKFSLDELAKLALKEAEERNKDLYWNYYDKRWEHRIKRKWKKCLYLWTFTFYEPLPINEARKRWKGLMQRIKIAYPNFCGVRAFEMHDTHGLHVHLVSNKRCDVNIIRNLCWKRIRVDGRNAYIPEWGRIHVKAIYPDQVGYIAKYLNKQKRANFPCFKGWQLWASIGKFNSTRIKDVILNTNQSRSYKEFKERYPRFLYLSYWVRRQIVKFHAVGFEDYAYTMCLTMLDQLPSLRILSPPTQRAQGPPDPEEMHRLVECKRSYFALENPLACSV